MASSGSEGAASLQERLQGSESVQEGQAKAMQWSSGACSVLGMPAAAAAARTARLAAAGCDPAGGTDRRPLKKLITGSLTLTVRLAGITPRA